VIYYETYFEKALDYIHNNYIYDIKISDIAKYLGIDSTYLYKLFKKNEKISAQKYLINYRLNMAEKMLRETDLSITEISYSCGFKDASSFHRHFRKHTGITALQYRSKLGCNQTPE
jgi:AraC-like DNA-binding protein